MRRLLRATLAGCAMTYCTWFPIAAKAIPFEFTRIADTAIDIPEGTGTFTGFGGVVLNNGNIAFVGEGTGGQNGIYVQRNGNLEVVANRASELPNNSSQISGFLTPSLSGGRVTFSPHDRGLPYGVYRWNNGAIELIVDRTTPIPGTENTFVGGFGTNISSDGNTIAFRGLDTENRSGLYHWDNGSLGVIADTTSPLPGSRPGTFSSLESHSLDDGNVAFVSTGTSNQYGVYLWDGTEIDVIADRDNPGGSFFFPPSIDGDNVAFSIATTNSHTVYLSRAGTFSPIIDTTTEIPEGTGAFINNFESTAVDNGSVVFKGRGNSGQEGIYFVDGDNVSKVIAKGDELDGKIIQNVSFDREGFNNDSIAFIAGFSDSVGIYRADLTAVEQPLTFESVVKNSITFTPSGTGVLGEFVPKFGLTLQDAAELGGYDHFNWVNVVTDDKVLNFPFLAELLNLTDQDGNLPTVPYFDPVPGGFQYQVNELGLPFPIADDLPWYWDEEFSFGGQRAPGAPVIPLSKIDALTFPLNEATELLFQDTPGGPANIEFLTALAGVFDDGTGEIIAYDGTITRWVYDSGFDELFIFGDGSLKEFEDFTAEELGLIQDIPILRDNIDQSLVRNGSVAILDYPELKDLSREEKLLLINAGVSVRGVPEPPTFFIAIFGIFIVLIFRQRAV